METQPTPALDSRAEAEQIGAPIVPVIIAIGYGGFEFFQLGFNPIHSAQTYVLVFGGVASLVSIAAYSGLAHAPPGRSWALASAAFAGLIPWLYSLHLMGYLGLYRGWEMFGGNFSFGRTLACVFWLVVGYRLLFTFWKITERVKQRSLGAEPTAPTAP